MLALLDCNNFFVSCERALDPSLCDVPVVVLSNNDGCVISRSNEAKAAGIPMGAPAFQYAEVFRKFGVMVFSAKFELYNHYSTGIMRLVAGLVPEYEVYSIDEVFLDFSGFKYFNLSDYCEKIRESVMQDFKIPVSIGLAPTKTLCKVANHTAKKHPEFGGIFFLDTKEKIEAALENLEIGEVWGIGRRLCAKMHGHGVYTCADFLKMPEMWVRKQMGVHGVRMVGELKGIPQIGLQDPKDKQSISVTRSFMEMASQKSEVWERVETFAMYCAEKLRRQHSCCKTLTVFVQTNRFRQDLPAYQKTATVQLPNPTNSTITLCREASKLFNQIFQEGFQYKKAGVIVSDFVPEKERMANLFEEDLQDRHLPIMHAMDKLNRKYGKDKIHIGSASGSSTYGRAGLSEEYQEFLKHNTAQESNYRFH